MGVRVQSLHLVLLPCAWLKLASFGAPTVKAWRMSQDEASVKAELKFQVVRNWHFFAWVPKVSAGCYCIARWELKRAERLLSILFEQDLEGFDVDDETTLVLNYCCSLKEQGRCRSRSGWPQTPP